jgi:arsenite methyltransferase
MDFPLIRTIFRELVCSRGFNRAPEGAVMASPAAVTAFARAGEPNGVLSGVYAYHLAQFCAMIRPGDRVLDLGCGPANLLVGAARLNPESHFIGVDLSPAMLEQATALAQASGLRNVELRMDDFTKLESIADVSIDVVLSSMALHHLPDVESLAACLAAVDRVLAADGGIYICDFGRLKSLRSIEYFIERAIPKNEPLLAGDYHASLKAAFSRQEVEAALRAAMRRPVRVYATAVGPLMMVLKTDERAPLSRPTKAAISEIVARLPRERREDLRQLRSFLRLGGLKWAI